MAYLISDVRRAEPLADHRYLFDANIWLNILEGDTFGGNYRPYVVFFNKILGNRVNAKIVLPAILVSEIINRIIRDVYYVEFQINYPGQIQDIRKGFKQIYRPSVQYAVDMERVCASIRSYHQKCEFLGDNLNAYAFKDIIKKIPPHLDFNDYLYTKMALQQGIIIVTNDRDFHVEDIHIITSQQSLLALNSPAIVVPTSTA